MASYSFIGRERVQRNQIILQDLILPNRLKVHAYFLGKLTKVFMLKEVTPVSFQAQVPSGFATNR